MPVVVTHLTSVHNIDTDTRIFLRECRTLAAHGFEVKLIAPGDAPWTRDGVELLPVRRPKGRRHRMSATTRAVYRLARSTSADIFHFHDPELIPVGLALSRRAKVVYDVHEDMPALIRTKEWIPRPLRPLAARMTGRVERAAVTQFDLVIAATAPVGARFPPAKTAVVQNFPFLHELDQPTAPPYEERPPVIAYVGNIQPTRGAREMVSAVALVPESLGARLELAGGCNPPELAADLDRLPGRDHVEMLGWLDRSGVRALLARARLGLCVLHPTASFVEAQPTKLYEYMAAGIPFIASDFPRWREMVAKHDCGIVVDPLDPQAIADAMAWLLTHPGDAAAMGRRGRTAVESSYNWEAEAASLLAAYARLT